MNRNGYNFGQSFTTKIVSSVLFLSASLFVSSVHAEGFYQGVPIVVQKSDCCNNSLHLLYIEFAAPIAYRGCTSDRGVVVLDSNESSKAALSMALAAQASGKKFRCYIRANTCSPITGAVDTYPVCDTYPAVVN